jgi:hypothetical protein
MQFSFGEGLKVNLLPPEDEKVDNKTISPALTSPGNAADLRASGFVRGLYLRDPLDRCAVTYFLWIEIVTVSTTFKARSSRAKRMTRRRSWRQ